MKIKVVGAAGGEVTGSAYFVQTDHTRILRICVDVYSFAV
jgi:hypothetical protein